jgi:hypothetical protein
MTDAQMDRCRKRLEQFLVDLLEPVGRSERRHWGSVYVRGLLLDGSESQLSRWRSACPMATSKPCNSSWGRARGSGRPCGNA